MNMPVIAEAMMREQPAEYQQYSRGGFGVTQKLDKRRAHQACHIA
ncbi:TPA: hypothetical protein KEV35_004607 [Escherichia coli]|nr:hypothetical protein [Escherichia coli]